jgi:hypothetical protein
MQEMGVKIQNGGPHLLVLYWRAGGIHVVKDNGGSGWLRWLLKQGGVTLATQNRYNRCALGLFCARRDYSPPIQGA